MKIIDCHIINFGKLSNISYSFKDGLNIICEKNGYGKSTLAVFLKTMFYGFANENKRNDNENERRKYMPWQGGVYGGEITFSVDDKEYLLTRTFGSRDKEDVTKLYDNKTKVLIDDIPKNIGENIFKIDQRSFLKTIFISQSDCDTESTDSINSKLGDIVKDIADVDNYEAGIKQLTDAINNLSPDRKTGELYKIKNSISMYQEIIRQKEFITQDIDNNRKKLNAVKGRLLQATEKKTLLEGKQQKAITQAKNRELNNSYSDICRNYDRIKQEYHSARGYFNNQDIDDNDINACYDMVIRQGSLKSSIGISDDDYGEASIYKAKNRISSKAALFNFMSIILIVLCVVMLFINKYLAVSFGIVGAFLFLIGLTNKNKGIRYLKEYVKLTKNINEFLDRYNKDTLPEIERFRKLQERYSVLIRVKSEYEKIIETKSEYEDEKRTDNTGESGNAYDNIGEITHDLNLCGSEIVACNNEISSLENIISKLSDKLQEIEEAKGQYKDLVSKYEKLSYSYNVYQKTKELLIYSKENFTSKYISPINNHFKEYFRYLSTKDTNDYMINTNLEIMIKEEGMWHELKKFSSGQRSMVGICMRMAMLDAMYSDDKPFVIFDDPFVYFDNERLELAMSLMRNISKEKQVIYFTCHESRVIL